MLDPQGTLDPSSDPRELFRTLKYELTGQQVTVIRSGYDFSKQTPGAARGVNYLLDERGLLATVRQTKADVKERVIRLGALPVNAGTDSNIRHKDATVRLAHESGSAIEEAVNGGSKVVILRGAHDAMDLAGLLRATGGKVGIVIVDTHADINTPTTSTSKNPHGMWVSILLGDGEGLASIMEDAPPLDMDNVIYIGSSQLQDAERARLIAKGITKIFTAQQLSSGMGPVYQAIDELQRRVPIWLDVDEDGLQNAAATMQGGRVRPDDLIGIATQIGTNQQLQGMHPSMGVGVSEFQAPSPDDDREVETAEYQAEVLKTVVHQALGAGYREDSTDTGAPRKARARRRGPSGLRTALYAGAAAFAAGVAGLLVGQHIGSQQESAEKKPGTLAAKMEKDYLDRQHAAVLQQFHRSAFQEQAARLRVAADSNDQAGIRDTLQALVSIYHLSLNDAPDQRTASDLGQIALSTFVEGFGHSAQCDPYYQQFVNAERKARGFSLGHTT